MGYQVAYELEFKLSTLIDKPFENKEEFEQLLKKDTVTKERSKDTKQEQIKEIVTKAIADFRSANNIPEDVKIDRSQYSATVPSAYCTKLADKARAAERKSAGSIWNCRHCHFCRSFRQRKH